MSTLKVAFASDTLLGKNRSYSYTAPAGDYAVGDLVIVDSPSSGFVITTLLSVEEADYEGNKPVVGVVSLQAYKDHQAKLARKKEILAQLDRAAKERAEVDRYAHLASDPALAALVAELKGL